MHGVFEMRVLVARRRRVGLLPVRERSQRLLVCEGSRVMALSGPCPSRPRSSLMAMAIRANVRPRLLVRQD